MTTHEFYFPSSDGKHSIRAKEWRPDKEPKAIVYLAHGIEEHIDRYEGFAEFLTKNNILMAANDHLGHGRSAFPPEDLGYFADQDGWKFVVEDIKSFLETQWHLHPDIPLFVFGHSMGSFLARCFAIMNPHADVKGYVLSGTGNASRFLSGAGAILCDAEIRAQGPRGHSQKLGNLIFGSYNKKFQGRTSFDWLTRDDAVVDRYIEDPFCGFNATNSMYRDLIAQIRYVTDIRNIRKMNRRTPILLVSGSMDPVGGYGKEVVRLHGILTREHFEDITYILYENARHEILNELQKEDVMEDILEWLESRIGNEAAHSDHGEQ